MFEIAFSDGVADDLKAIQAHERTRILDRIEVHLTHGPNRPTRNRKILVGLVPPWEHVIPVWELRIGEYRVFYDVDESAGQVVVRAIRLKPAHKSTGEIL